MVSTTHWVGITSDDGTELQVGREADTLLLRVRSDKVHTTLSMSAEGIEWLVVAIRSLFPGPPSEQPAARRPPDSPLEVRSEDQQEEKK